MKLFVIFLVCFNLLYIFSGAVFASQEKPMLESISFAEGNGETETISFKLNGADLPKIFTIKGDNPRLVFDFHNAAYDGKAKIPVNGSKLVESIRSAVHRDPELKTRVVVDLTTDREVSYQEDFLVHSTTLKINLTPVGKVKTVIKPEPQGSKKPAEVQPEPVQVVAQAAKKQQEATEPTQTVEKKVVETIAAEPPPVKVNEPVTNAPQAIEKQAQEPEKPKTGTESTAEPTVPVNPAKSTVAAGTPVLLDVSFDGTSSKGELVQFKLNDFFAPTISAIEEGSPRVICDFAGMQMDPKVRTLIAAGGKYVDTIRVVQHHEPEKIRIVLDLQPNHSYDLQQVFFKDENTFVLIVNVLNQDQKPSEK
jgi:hypothetical protein